MPRQTHNQDGGVGPGDPHASGGMQPLRLMRDPVQATPLVGRIAARLATPATLRPSAGLLQRTADWAGQIAQRFALSSTRPNTPLTLIARLAYGPDALEAEEGLLGVASSPRSTNPQARAAGQPVLARRVTRGDSLPANTLRRTPFDPRIAPLDAPAAAGPFPADLPLQRAPLPRVRPVAQRTTPNTRLATVQRLEIAPVAPDGATPEPPATVSGSRSRPAPAEQARPATQFTSASRASAPLQRIATSTRSQTPGASPLRDPRIAGSGPLQRRLLGSAPAPLEQAAFGSDTPPNSPPRLSLGALRPVALSLQRMPLVSSSGAPLSSPGPSTAADLPLLSSGLSARTASPVAATTSGIWRSSVAHDSSASAASPPRTGAAPGLGAIGSSLANAAPGQIARLGNIAPLRQAPAVQRAPSLLATMHPAEAVARPAQMAVPSSQSAWRGQSTQTGTATTGTALVVRSALPQSRVATRLPSVEPNPASTVAPDSLPVVQTLRRFPDTTPNAPQRWLSRFTQQTLARVPLLRSALPSPAGLPESTGTRFQRTATPAPSGTSASTAPFGGLRAAATVQSLLARMQVPAQGAPSARGTVQPAPGETAGLRPTLQRSALPSPAQLVLLRSPITPVAGLAADSKLPARPRSVASANSALPMPTQRVVARPSEASAQGTPPQPTSTPSLTSVQRAPRIDTPAIQQQPGTPSAALSLTPASFRPSSAAELMRTSIVAESSSTEPQPRQPFSGATALLSRAWSTAPSTPALPVQASIGQRIAPGTASSAGLPLLRTALPALPQGPFGGTVPAGDASRRASKTGTLGTPAPAPLLMRVAAPLSSRSAPGQLPSPGSLAQPSSAASAAFPLIMRASMPATMASGGSTNPRLGGAGAPFPLLRATTPLQRAFLPSTEAVQPPVQRSPLTSLAPPRTPSVADATRAGASGIAPVQRTSRTAPFALLHRATMLTGVAPQPSTEAAPGATIAQGARASTVFPLLMRAAAPQSSSGPLPVDAGRLGTALPLLMRAAVPLSGGNSMIAPVAPSMLAPAKHSGGSAPFPLLMRRPAPSAEAGTPAALAAQSAPATVQRRATAVPFPLLLRTSAQQPSGGLPSAEAPGLTPVSVQRSSASAPFPLLLRTSAPQPSGGLPSAEAPGLMPAPVQRGSASAPFPLLLRTSAPQPSGGLPSAEAPGLMPAPVQRGSASAPFPLLLRTSAPQPSGGLPSAEAPGLMPAPVQRGSASAPFPLLLRTSAPQPSGGLPSAEAPGLMPAPVQRGSASAPFPLLTRAAPQTEAFAGTFSRVVPVQRSSAGSPFPLLLRTAVPQPSASADTPAGAMVAQPSRVAAPVPALMRAAAPQQRANAPATERSASAVMPAQTNVPGAPFPLLMRTTLAQTGADFFAAQPDRPAVAPVQRGGASAPFPLLMRAAAPQPGLDQPATASTLTTSAPVLGGEARGSFPLLMRAAAPQAGSGVPAQRGSASAPFPLLMRAAAPQPGADQPATASTLATSAPVLGGEARGSFPLLMRAAASQATLPPATAGGEVPAQRGPASAPFPLLMRAATPVPSDTPLAAEAGPAAIRTVQRTAASAPFPRLMRTAPETRTAEPAAPGAAPMQGRSVSAAVPVLMRTTPQAGISLPLAKTVPTVLETAQHSANPAAFPLLMRAAAPADPLAAQSARPAATAPFPAFLRAPIAPAGNATRSNTPAPLLMRAPLLQPDAAPLLPGPQSSDAPLVGNRGATLAAPLALPSIARIARTARLDAVAEEPALAGSPQAARQSSSAALFAQRLAGGAASTLDQHNSAASELPFVQAAGPMQDGEEVAFIETQSTLNPALQRTLSDELHGHAPAAQATSRRMELLRPAASTVQRDVTETAASLPASKPAPKASEQQGRGEPSAQEIERLAREVYSRLRQRLMVDAERLGR